PRLKPSYKSQPLEYVIGQDAVKRKSKRWGFPVGSSQRLTAMLIVSICEQRAHDRCVSNGS
ncbi:hypothetical protein JZ751_027670, partial [Albula glossodonta]